MNTQRILTANLMTVWSKFVFASIIGVLLNTIYSVVDGIFVGQGVGELGLAAINIVWPAITVILGSGMMLGVGASSLIAIKLGQDELEDAQKILGTTIASGILIGVLIMVIGFINVEPLLRVLGADDEIMPYAIDYFTVLYAVAVPYLLATALNPIVRSDGRPDLSMLMIGVGAIANIILDYLLVIVYDFGIQGAALATCASIMLSSTVSLYYFIKGSAVVKLKRHYFTIDLSTFKQISQIGLVSFGVQLSYGAILFLQNNVMYAYGSNLDVAIYTVAAYINCFFVNICMGVSQGVQPLIGYHFGANKTKRLKQLLHFTIVFSSLLGTLMLVGFIFYGEQIVRLFGVEETNIRYAYEYITLYCLGNPIIGIIFTMSAYYQAIGKNTYANFLSIGRGFVFQFIFTLVLPPFIGLAGVYASLPLAELCAMFILAIIMMSEQIKQRFVLSSV